MGAHHFSGTCFRRTILIVEDHEDTRDLYAEHFRQAGYRVETAAEGNEAIAVALRVKPDVIVIDLGMPVLDGADAIAVLRSYPATMRTPVVVCTGHPDLLTKRSLTYDAVVGKPCTAEDLGRAVSGVLRETPECAEST